MSFVLGNKYDIEHVMPHSGYNLQTIRIDAEIESEEEFCGAVNKLGNNSITDGKELAGIRKYIRGNPANWSRDRPTECCVPCLAASCSDAIEGFGQCGDDVVDVFNADGKSDQFRGDAAFEQVLIRELRVRS